jgi:two-component system response regulator YesN
MRTKKSNKLIDQTLEYINEHQYETTLSLKTIAKQVYANECYLSRMFKQETGENFITYLNKYRIEKAKDLIITTDLKTYEIAQQVGIINTRHFSKLFKSMVGQLPTEYKRRQILP